jgi:hypothetical protein
VWYTRRWEDAPTLEAPSLGSQVTNTGRQWQPTYELAFEMSLGNARRVDTAIDMMPQQHRSVLHRWAWQNHYNRGLIRKVEKIEGGTRVIHQAVFAGGGQAEAEAGGRPIIVVNDETLEAAQLALVQFLRELNVVLE